jgi:uncharacterized membrane protein YdfJ with MMPL/SSD domain
MTERLAVWSSRRPWLTLAGWVVALVAAIAITAAFVDDALSGDEEITSATDSGRADVLRSERVASEGAGGGAIEVIVVRSRWRRSMSRASSGGCRRWQRRCAQPAPSR